MKIIRYNFNSLVAELNMLMTYKAKPIKANRWQSIDIKNKPEMTPFELRDIVFKLDLNYITSTLKTLQNTIEPNLPWAEDHFQERVSGKPLNPGEQWKNWPWSHSANNFRKDEIFSHTYMERIWPKRAGETSTLNTGIRFDYGDLNDVIMHLNQDPYTRQAFLPIWFPEDTGVIHNERVPCTIGYLFEMRNSKLDITYWIRSCDYKRHFRDDVYLTIRLLMYVLNKLREIDPEEWSKVSTGDLKMFISNLHLFTNDYRELLDTQTSNE